MQILSPQEDLDQTHRCDKDRHVLHASGKVPETCVLSKSSLVIEERVDHASGKVPAIGFVLKPLQMNCGEEWTHAVTYHPAVPTGV